MKKNILLTILCITLFSCASKRSFQSFYNQHKNHTGVTAFQVPNFMRSLLGSISPEINNLFKNIEDFKFITFNEIEKTKQNQLVTEIDVITANNYKDIFRQNKPERIKILSAIEEGSTVKKAIIFNSTLAKTTVFYLKGNLDPNKLRKISETNQFEELGTKLIQQYQVPSIIQPITPNN